MQLQIAVLCGTVRLIHAVLLRTYFNPDECWQCLEPAHRLAFGYGHRTWEWAAGLRGYLHPVLFALLYKGLQAARLDTIWAVANGPQIMQAAFAAVTDFYVYKLAILLYGRNSARWTLLCQLTNWFNAYCLVRTYSNSFEALCTVMGVFYWVASNTTHLNQPVELSLSTQQAQSQAQFSSGNDVSQSVTPPHISKQDPTPGLQPNPSPACQQQGQQQLKQPCSPTRDSASSSHTSERQPVMTSRQKALWAAAVGVLFRPSSLLFWVPLGMYELRACKPRWRFILEAALIGGCTLLMGTFIDRVGYGRWVLVPWEFAKFNLLQAGSAMYGSHPWHWNFTQGLPTITVTHLPLAMWGVYLSRGRLELAALVLWSLLMYGLPAHKEFRFLLPALLLLMPYCGVALHDLASRWSQHGATAEALLHKAASSCKVQKDKLQPHKVSASNKWAFTLDRSAVAKARELSSLLEEAPQEGGCPFMVPTDATPEPSKGRSCPFSSGRAPIAQARKTPVHVAEDSTCPSVAANPASVTVAPEGPAAGSCVNSCVEPGESSHLQQPKAMFHSGQGGPSPESPLPHPAPDMAIAQAEPQSSAMTEEELKEYEQAFAVEPNEAMLQAYAALLADKVTEADREGDDTPQHDSCAADEADKNPDFVTQCDHDKSEEADREVDDTPQCKGSGHVTEQLTQSRPVHPPSPSNILTDADATREAHCGKHPHFAEASPSEVGLSSAQTSSAEMTLDSAAAASTSQGLNSNSLGSHAATVQSKAAVRALCQGLHQAYQGSLSRVKWCCEYLSQQSPRWHVLMIICFGVQLAMTLYFSLVHQRGQIDVMHYLAHEAQLQPSMRVLFLTPCHATPWFSYVHSNITMDFLDCSPPGWAEATRCLNTPGCSVQGLQSPDMQSMPPQHEYGLFTQNPLQVLQSRWVATKKHSMPTHLVMFQDLVPAVSRYIAEQGFALKKTFFNCHVQVDAGSSIWLWKQIA